MSTNVFSGAAGGQHRIYHFNMVGVAEVVVDTGGNAAESETGGGNLNVVPKDGGNRFKVYAIGSFTNHGLTSGKVPDSLIARGSAPDQKSGKRGYESGSASAGRWSKTVCGSIPPTGGGGRRIQSRTTT